MGPLSADHRRSPGALTDGQSFSPQKLVVHHGAYVMGEPLQWATLDQMSTRITCDDLQVICLTGPPWICFPLSPPCACAGTKII